MNKAYKIKNYLKKVGRVCYLADGDWTSMPFYAVLEQKWKSNKTDFEPNFSEIGEVSKDYYTYIGPFDHDINSISSDGYVIFDGIKYVFKKKEKVVITNDTQYYWGILRRVWEGEDD